MAEHEDDVNTSSVSGVSDEEDPIIASYDVYLRPPNHAQNHLYILQFPNRPARDDYSSTTASLPLELRLKPRAGLVELDVPIDVWKDYDRAKGAFWGTSLQKSTNMKSNSGNAPATVAQGLAGGFGIGGVAPGPGRGRKAQEDDTVALQQQALEDFPNGITQGRILTKQTLGGAMIPKEASSPKYFIGAFRKGQLHMSPVDEMVTMRPQFHHIDAAAELEKLSKPRPAETAAQRAAAVTMSVKPVGELGGEPVEKTLAERIRDTQEEPWKRLDYVDDNSNEAWDTFEELFVETEGLPVLQAKIDNEGYLDAISAPRDEARLSRAKREVLAGVGE